MGLPGLLPAQAKKLFTNRWNVTSTSASTYSASPNEWVRSSGAPAVISLPASPNVGDQVAVQRAAGSITVSIATGSGHDINGQTTVGIAGISIPVCIYTYVGSGHWVMAGTTGIFQFGISIGAQGGYLIAGHTVSTTASGYTSGATSYVQGGDKNLFVDTASGVNTLTFTLKNPDASFTSIQNYQHTKIKNDTTGPVTITCASTGAGVAAGTIDGAASYVLNPGDSAEFAVISAPSATASAVVEVVASHRPRKSAAGSLSANVPLTPANTLVTVLETATLDVGTWLLNVHLTPQGATASTPDTIEATIAGGTAAYTLAGSGSAQNRTQNATVTGSDSQLAMTVLATVTVAGTVQIKARTSASDSPNIMAATLSGYGNLSGYVATKVA